MAIELQFLGAAQNVTGSRYLLTVGTHRLLVDCGLYQERDLRDRNWDPFPVPPSQIDAILLTHAHIDHCGYLPRLVRQGFAGPVYGTAATGEIAKLVLDDSARLQSEDVEFKRQRHRREGRTTKYPEEPLYTLADVERCCSRFRPVAYGKPVQPIPGVEAVFHDAGHILGSAMIRLTLDAGGGTSRTLVCSGDLGRWDRPLIHDPTLIGDADYVLVESTYGDREHDPANRIAEQLAEVINDTRKRGGNVVIPSFAVERAQEVLYYLNELLIADRIPHLLVFMDSPMAAGVIDIFERHPELLDEDTRQRYAAARSPFEFPGLKVVRSVEDSKSINHIRGTVVVIAGSGMCTGGRIKHHLVNNIARPESTVLFVGYQAVGTLGRLIADGAREVRILGRIWPVRARVEHLYGFSAHADRRELMRWLRGFNRPPRRVLVTHGEPEAASAFAQHVAGELGWAAQVPAYGERMALN